MKGRTSRKRNHRAREVRAASAAAERLDQAAELYLSDCYDARTTARADEFALFLRQARPYISRIAIAATGRSLTALLREKQLQRAKKLLASMPESITIEQIAIASAFGTPWTFNRCFKEAFGITPGAYRRRLRNEGARSPSCRTPLAGPQENKT